MWIASPRISFLELRASNQSSRTSFCQDECVFIRSMADMSSSTTLSNPIHRNSNPFLCASTSLSSAHRRRVLSSSSRRVDNCFWTMRLEARTDCNSVGCSLLICEDNGRLFLEMVGVACLDKVVICSINSLFWRSRRSIQRFSSSLSSPITGEQYGGGGVDPSVVDTEWVCAE